MRLAMLVVLASGCSDFAGDAKQAFSESLSCPEARVEVHARTDIHYSSFYPIGAPPSDIAADPERVKLWLKTKTDGHAWLEKTRQYFEATGCGQKRLYECAPRPSSGSRGSLCSNSEYPKQP